MELRYKCKICGQECKALGIHVLRTHKLSNKEYYDKYVKREGEGICPVCGKENNFKNIICGYSLHCSEECKRKDKGFVKPDYFISKRNHNKLIAENGNFECAICGQKTNRLKTHILNQHGIADEKEYYDKYVKKEGDGFCLTCGKETKFASATSGYYHFCCNSCAQQSEITRKKIKDTFMKSQGFEGEYTDEEYSKAYVDYMTSKDPDFYKKIGKKAHATFVARTGLSSPWQLEKCKETRKKTKLEKYGDPYYTNREKCKKTLKERTGYEYAFQVPEVIENMRQKSLEKHGTEHWTNREKCKETFLERYGEDCLFKTKEFRDKIKETNLEKYGVEYNWQRPDIKEKIRQTNIERYGYPIASQNPEIRRKSQKRYTFDNKHFDSSFEIAYYVWLKDHDIKFEYQPDIAFEYEYDGKKKTYHPDFKVGDEYVELKGLHFFENKDGNGKMINPYDRKQDAGYEAKHQCMIKNGVKIITDGKIYVKYLTEKYGKDCLKQFRNK